MTPDNVSDQLLLVDDDSHFLALTQYHLQWKWPVKIASSGHEGLELIRAEGPFAVVVADYNMPNMNGIEFLHETHLISPQTIKVMLTVWNDIKIAVSALHQAKIYRFLNKPCPRELLIATITDCLEQYRLSVMEQYLMKELSRSNEQLRALNARLEGLHYEEIISQQAKSNYLLSLYDQLQEPASALLDTINMFIGKEHVDSVQDKDNQLKNAKSNVEIILDTLQDMLDIEDELEEATVGLDAGAEKGGASDINSESMVSDIDEDD